MSGPEFDGLTFDEAWALKKQLRIRDRNRAINVSQWRRKHVHAVRWTIIKWVSAFVSAFLVVIWRLMS